MIRQGNNYWVLGLSLYFFCLPTKRKSQGFLFFWQCFQGLPLGVEVAILIVIDDRRILRPCAAAFQDLRSWGHAAAEKEGPESGTRRTYLIFLGFFSFVMGCFHLRHSFCESGLVCRDCLRWFVTAAVEANSVRNRWAKLKRNPCSETWLTVSKRDKFTCPTSWKIHDTEWHWQYLRPYTTK